MFVIQIPTVVVAGFSILSERHSFLFDSLLGDDRKVDTVAAVNLSFSGGYESVMDASFSLL